MRLRRKGDTREWLREHRAFVELEPRRNKGRWREVFGNDRPIHVELGMGKGKFISELSAMHPEINFIGIDMYDELIRRAGERVLAQHADKIPDGPGNVRLALGNIERIEEMFDTGEIRRIYLNFSDPWPKKRHAHRRLTHPAFLRKYREILDDCGDIHFKTDSSVLFEFSLNAFSDLGLRMRRISLDLHREGTPPNHIFTEYEQKFVEQGMPIYRCEVVVGEAALREHVQESEAKWGP